MKLLWVYLFIFLTFPGNADLAFSQKFSGKFDQDIIKLLKKDIIARADQTMNLAPETVTSTTCSRSAGGKHDFFSEGDYWWPDPKKPDGPYIQRDGMSNPEIFVSHRKAMIRLSQIIGSLASAYKITGNEKYVKQALVHLKAWFVDTTTKMNPSLLYAQAIKGRFTGRGTGIIDTIHLMEVAQGILAMQNASCFDKGLLNALKSWFAEYIKWLIAHPYGKAEMNAANNHGTCYIMQLASFSKLTGNNALLDTCRMWFKNVLLPNQMANDGSFPLELKRTKPYSYSLFNLDALVTLCQIISDKNHDCWNYQTKDGKSIRKGIEYLYPYVADKSKWTLPKDVMYWENWPIAQPFLVFGANAYQNQCWFDTWKTLEHFPAIEEVIRNVPIRNPLIWMN